MINRRKWLKTAVALTAGVGALGAMVPFVASWRARPDKIRDHDVEVDISRLKPGQQVEVLWLGRSWSVRRRTPQELAQLEISYPNLRDPLSEHSEQPESARNSYRAVDPEIFVFQPLCTHLGCQIWFRPEPAAPELGEDWPGGFVCPCHGSRYDLAGRVFQGQPAPLNLVVPPHGYRNGNLIIGMPSE